MKTCSPVNNTEREVRVLSELSNINAENALLLSLIHYPENISGCPVKGGDFYSTLNQNVYKCLKEMDSKGYGIDQITVPDYLNKMGIDGDSFITENAQIGYAKYPNEYIDAILDYSKRRKLFIYFEELKGKIFNSDIIRVNLDAISNILKTGIHSWTPENTIPEWILSEPESFSFIIPGLLASGVVGFLYGSGGTFKSLASLWLVLQRATIKIDGSQRWLDKFELPFGKSVFFSAEDVQLDLQHRVFNIVSAMNENRPDVPKQVFINAIMENCRVLPREKWLDDGEPYILDSNGPTSKVNRIVDFINSFGADLAVLETCSRIAAIDENDNSAGARLVGILETIRDKTGATILVIDHSSKINRGVKTDLQGQNSLRGAGSKLDNARFGLLIEAQKRSNGSDILQITNSKSFRCKRADSFKVKIQYPKFTLVEDEALEPDIFNLVIEDVKQNPGAKQREIRQRLKKGRDIISKTLKEAIEENLIENRGKKEGYFYAEN